MLFGGKLAESESDTNIGHPSPLTADTGDAFIHCPRAAILLIGTSLSGETELGIKIKYGFMELTGNADTGI